MLLQVAAVGKAKENGRSRVSGLQEYTLYFMCLILLRSLNFCVVISL